MRTVADVVASLSRPAIAELPAPAHRLTDGPSLGLAVSSMKDHTTDEGWQLFEGVRSVGYRLCGYGYEESLTHVPTLLAKYSPGTVVMQDIREWDVRAGDFRDERARFLETPWMRTQPCFRVTVVKDAQHDPARHRAAADAIGCHAWIVYYHPSIVKRLAPYVREKHMVRTYHTLDRAVVPAYSPAARDGCLLSGAVSAAYPLRTKLFASARTLPGARVLKHPGYHRRGCSTPSYLRTLSKFKVALCTSSKYGYLLRKIVEATACGCVALTDLPVDDVVPEVDANLVRVSPTASVREIGDLLRHLYATYDPEKQAALAAAAVARFDYRAEGARLAAAVEAVRRSYSIL